MLLIAFISLVFSAALSSAEARFDVIWNVPTFLCSIKFGVNLTDDLLKYGILVNKGESFSGDKIVMFYEYALGKYPKIDSNKVDINGGLPLLGNLDEHLMQAERDIVKIVPNPNFNGLGVIDWEAWRPTWEYLWGSLSIYKNRTLELVRVMHPSSPDNFVQDIAKTIWEDSAKQWMSKTLRLAKKLRSDGMWCYYLFPDCYNYGGKDHPSEFSCGEKIRRSNDELSWMWNKSSALCPSIYFSGLQINYNESQRTWFLQAKLAEAVRVSRPHTKIYPFINYLVHDSRTPVPVHHFWKMLAITASMGLDGAVIWGSSDYFSEKTKCEELEVYINDVIAPAVTTVSSNANRCSKEVCNGNGRCTWPSEPFTSWKYLADTQLQRRDPVNIVCRCQTGEGRYCN